MDGIMSIIWSGVIIQWMAFTLCGVIIILALLGRVTYKAASLVIAMIWAIYTVVDVMTGQHIASYIDAVMCVGYLYKWWKHGGGDDTKRRLRRLKEAFKPVRRTAPAAA